MPKKKKILFHSDFSKTKTGFARNAKEVLLELYSTGKYDLVEYCCAPMSQDDKLLETVPWKAYGSLPTDPFVRDQMARNPGMAANVKYGGYFIDEIIAKEKPDFYIGVNDFWGFTDYYNKDWWNKINCALWVTVDSLPLLPDSIAEAHKIKNFWVWSKFAEKEFHRLGHTHVKTLHAAFDVSRFHPLSKANKEDLRERHGINKDDFIVGFVFRNQLRKLVGTLIESFSIAKKTHANMKLLLHTSWTEGWDIEKLAKDYEVDLGDILTTHVCPDCRNFEIKAFDGEPASCGHCGSKNQVTPKTYLGVSEEQMNEIYNLMDYYVQPVTSGGLEMPLVEAMMAGIPTATCNYACGEEYIDTGITREIPFNYYREFGTQFLKSQPDPAAFAEILEEVVDLDLSEVSKKGHEWAKDSYDVKKTCDFIQNWVDHAPDVDHDSYEIGGGQKVDSKYFPPSDIEDDLEWCKDLVRGVCNLDESDESSSIKKIMRRLEKGESRDVILNAAHKSAEDFENSREQIKDYINPDDNNVVLISPVELWDKLLLMDKIPSLTEGDEKLAIIGDEYDMQIYSQYASFSLIPRSDDSTNIGKLLGMKPDGKTAFQKIYTLQGHEFSCIDNTSE